MYYVVFFSLFLSFSSLFLTFSSLFFPPPPLPLLSSPPPPPPELSVEQRVPLMILILSSVFSVQDVPESAEAEAGNQALQATLSAIPEAALKEIGFMESGENSNKQKVREESGWKWG